MTVVPRPSPVRDRVRALVLGGALHAWTIEELLARVRAEVTTADYSTVFWRSRVTNPVNAWYAKQCDGTVRTDVWQVFWRGIAVEHIPEAVAYSLEQPKDFPRV